MKSRREAAKEERRKRIAAAARAMIEERGEAGFSMRDLAASAGVSQATPYNLFGTKHEVLLQVFNDDLASFVEEFESIKSPDALERYFDFIKLSRTTLERSQPFYREIMQLISTHAPSDLRSGLMQPRGEIYRRLTVKAIDDGYIRSDINPAICARIVEHIIGGSLQRWVSGEINMMFYEHEVSYGIALVLASVCVENHRSRLAQRADAHSIWLEKVLSKGSCQKDGAGGLSVIEQTDEP